MMTFTLDNPTEKTPARVLLSLLRQSLHRDYSLFCGYGADPIETRARRTRRALEAELYADGSGLEVACFGWWLLVGVEAKQGIRAAART